MREAFFETQGRRGAGDWRGPASLFGLAPRRAQCKAPLSCLAAVPAAPPPAEERGGQPLTWADAEAGMAPAPLIPTALGSEGSEEGVR